MYHNSCMTPHDDDGRDVRPRHREGDPFEDEAREEWERARKARAGRRRDRKEHVLHTRISEQLAEDIRQVADDLRVPVSNLVRNVLEAAFEAAERVSEDVGEILDDVLNQAERASDQFRRYQERRRHREDERRRRYAAEAEVRDVEAEPAEPEPADEPARDTAFPGVVAWQKVVLNTDRRCAATGEKIAAGEKAFLGICDDGRPGPVLKKAPEPA